MDTVFNDIRSSACFGLFFVLSCPTPLHSWKEASPILINKIRAPRTGRIHLLLNSTAAHFVQCQDKEVPHALEHDSRETLNKCNDKSMSHKMIDKTMGMSSRYISVGKSINDVTTFSHI